ncbi:MAG: ABC transporter permease subunit [Anaerolineae bacterium]|nr:ABC transporter permease subunit [Anaerolineae bacterium]
MVVNLLHALSAWAVPVMIVLIPLYALISAFRWVDTYQGILDPNFASAFAVFLTRQAVGTVPMDLIDAARIDGASELRIFGQHVMPLSLPSLAALATLEFTYTRAGQAGHGLLKRGAGQKASVASAFWRHAVNGV